MNSISQLTSNTHLTSARVPAFPGPRGADGAARRPRSSPGEGCPAGEMRRVTPRWSHWAQDLPRQVRGHVAPETPCWPWEQPSPFLPQIRRPWGFRQLYFSYLVSLVQALLSVVQLLVQVALLFTEQLLKRKRTRVWAWRSRPGARGRGPTWPGAHEPSRSPGPPSSAAGPTPSLRSAAATGHKRKVLRYPTPGGRSPPPRAPGRQPGGLALPALPSLPPGGAGSAFVGVRAGLASWAPCARRAGQARVPPRSPASCPGSLPPSAGRGGTLGGPFSRGAGP